MALFFRNYDKPGPGIDKDEPPKAAPIRFFELYFRKFTKLLQANLVFMIPVAVAAVLMVLLYFSPIHFTLQLPGTSGDPVSLDIWILYVMPLPLILLAPFTAGLTFISRNFVREEHAFVWSDFWEAVKKNWKYFLLNGVVIYLVYFILSFAMIYYYNNAARNSLLYVLLGVCVVVAVIFLFAQYYLPVMFIMFDLKFGQAYKNALIFTAAGFGRNLLITVVLGALLFLFLGVIPLMPLTILIIFLFFGLIFFSFSSFLINFAVYPIIDQYLIKPYERKMEEEKYGAPQKPEKDPLEEKYSGLFSQPDDEEEEDDKEKYVYVNGKLVKKSDLENREDDS